MFLNGAAFVLICVMVEGTALVLIPTMAIYEDVPAYCIFRRSISFMHLYEHFAT